MASRAEEELGIGDPEHGEASGEPIARRPRRSRAARASRARRGSCRGRGGRPGAACCSISIDSCSALRCGPPRCRSAPPWALEVEAVAAVDDRRQHLLSLGRGEHEHACGGGSSSVLRNAFQAAVESMWPRRGCRPCGDRNRRVGDRVTQLADVVDRVVRRGVHLDHVERPRRAIDTTSRMRRMGRPSGRARNSGTRRGSWPSRLAGPARPDEQVRVVDLVALHRIATACGRRAPGRPLGERPRPVAA